MYLTYREIYSPKAAEYIKEARRKIIYLCLKKYFDDFVYERDSYISEYIINNAELFNGTLVKGKNLLNAKYNGITFMCEEVKIGFMGSRFNGIWIAIQTNFHFHGHIQIVEKKSVGADVHISHYMKRKETESIKFNQDLDVYADDDQLPFYILTPQLIEMLIKIKDLEGQMVVGFSGGYLHIALNRNKEFFKIIFNKNTYSQRDKILKECKLIKDVMVELSSISNKLIDQPVK
jgi:hypothetical protein